MSASLESFQQRIPYFIEKIRLARATLRSALSTNQNPVEVAVADVRRQAAAEVLGAFSQYLTGRRRPGQRIGRIAVDANRAARRAHLEADARASAVSILNEMASAVDLALEDPIDWRFQRRIRVQVARARSARRAATVLDRMEVIVHELSAYSTPEDDFSVVRRLDRRFRSFLRERLSTRGENWWVLGVPVQLQSKVNRGRMVRGTPQADPLNFLTFGDYSKIILGEPNWSEIFAPLLGDRTQFESKMARLTSLRNDIAHSRRLTAGNRVELRELAGRILPGQA